MKLYKHFKGGIYKYLCTATNSETLEEMIIYQSLKDGKLWVRPSKMFSEEVSPGVKRFTELGIDDTDIHCHPKMELDLNLSTELVIVDVECKDLFSSYDLLPSYKPYQPDHIIVNRSEYESLIRYL